MAQLLLTPAAALFVSQAHHLLDLRKAPWLPKSILPELTNPFRCREWTKPSEQLLLSRRQHPHPRGDDRERMTRARQAAEALFTPKRQITEQLVSDSALADQSARKPRVLATSPTALIHHEEVEAPVSSQQQTAPEVPRSQFARIRALVKYGMKPPQVAEVYGVAIGAIEAILRKA
jgi:hypothetical protein